MAKEDSHALEQADFHHHKTDTDQGKVQRSRAATARPTSLSAGRSGTTIVTVTNINEIKNRTSNVIVATDFLVLCHLPAVPLRAWFLRRRAPGTGGKEATD